MNKSIHIRVLYTCGCPNAFPVIDLVQWIEKEIGTPVAVEPVPVISPGMAVELRCLESPAVQINGIDIEPEAPCKLGVWAWAVKALGIGSAFGRDDQKSNQERLAVKAYRC